MAHFDSNLWKKIAPRFKEVRGTKNVDKFVAEHDLLGLKWRMLEAGRMGMSVESLVKVCEALDVSPTWLIFGKGRKTLSELRWPLTAEQVIEDAAMELERLWKDGIDTAAVKQEIFQLVKEIRSYARQPPPPPQRPSTLSYVSPSDAGARVGDPKSAFSRNEASHKEPHRRRKSRREEK